MKSPVRPAIPDTTIPHASSLQAARVSRRGVLLAVGVGTCMAALDTSVVNTVLPVVTRALDSNVAAMEWVVATYLLVVSGLLLSVPVTDGAAKVLFERVKVPLVSRV